MRATLALSLLLASPLVLAQAETNRTDWVTNDHTVTLAGKPLNYTTTAGTMPMRDRNGELEGRIYFTYYKAKGSGKRPLTFVWNGGPGSASVWLHLGWVGPKRVKMGPNGLQPDAPYEMVVNDESILPETDIVCIDPVGTGYSRPARPEYGARFWGVQEDISSMGEFIRMFLNEENRWLSPIFLCGESYGTFRAAGVSDWLADNGIGVNGLIMVSTLTNYGTVRPDKSNPIPVALNLPTMTATAWYHKKLSANWQKQPIKKVVDASREFMYETLIPGLVKGTAMTADERTKVVNGLAEFTGLSKEFIARGDGKVSLSQFYTELLRSDRLAVGRLDGRFTGYLRNGNSLSPDYDASNTGITGPFTSVMNDYARNELGYKTNNKYFVLGEGLTAPWKFGDGIADTSEALRRAISKNSFMKVLYAMGYYDFATPFAATEFGVNQMELDKRLLGNLSYTFYEAGHMMYIHDESRKKLTADVVDFMRKSLK